MDEALYSVRQAAEASGVPANTVRSWLQRGHLRLMETDKRAEENGLGHLLSLRSVLRLAAMGALVAAGVEPAAAGQAAIAWTDVSSDPALQPGELYAPPFTILCVYPSGWSQVRHMLPNTIASDLFSDLTTGFSGAVTAILLDRIDKQVRSRLNLHGAR